ncbi:hypothetical protein RhiJN_22789 [Ceratobasidium sp. AG-Ba]|nr:hypothetical protein RhiJN_22789 [Ceratobasidium sp. AG-Ba]
MSHKAIRSAEDTLHQLVKTRKGDCNLDAWLAYLQAKAGAPIAGSIHIMRAGLPNVDPQCTPGPQKRSYVVDFGVAIVGDHCVLQLELADDCICQYAGYGGPFALGTGYYSFRSVLVVPYGKANNPRTLDDVVKNTRGAFVFGYQDEDGVGSMILKFYDTFGHLLAGVKGTGDGHLGWIMVNGPFEFVPGNHTLS